MKFAFKGIAVAGLAGALSALGGAAMAKNITLAYVANSMQFPYDAALAKGFQDACRQLGCKALVIDPRASAERQGNAIEDLITQKVDGIAIIATDSIMALGWVDVGSPGTELEFAL